MTGAATKALRPADARSVEGILRRLGRMQRALAVKQVRRGELGWQIELRVRDSIDVVRGPLLDEEQSDSGSRGRG